MNKNIGKTDGILRIIVGLAIIVYGVIEWSWIGTLGLIPIGTAIFSICPLYCPLRISTNGSDCKL